jgi:hypothetical protein
MIAVVIGLYIASSNDNVKTSENESVYFVTIYSSIMDA